VIKIDYGMLHLDVASRVRQYEEKPTIASPVSMGIYVMEPSVMEHIPEQGHFDFPDLVQALLAANEPVGAYVHEGLWFDIGRQEDYERAISVWSGNGHENGNGHGNGNGNGNGHANGVGSLDVRNDVSSNGAAAQNGNGIREAGRR
jgi:NDP-sugar pyrophosphorylase family protein